MTNGAYPIAIGFTGSLIDNNGVPVCELTAVLAALQRMICRSHLAASHGRKTLASLPQEDRLSLSLFLAEVKRPPTTFYLKWFSKEVSPAFSEPLTTTILSQLHEALNLYKALSVKTKPVTVIENLTLAIFNDLWEITSRIGKVGNIQSLWIRILDFKPISFDDTVLTYVESLGGSLSYLRRRNLTGVVIAPRTYERDFALVQTADHRVKVLAEEERNCLKFIDSLLDILAKYPDPDQQPYFFFSGQPRLRIGNDPDRFPEFVLRPKRVEGSKKRILFSYKPYKSNQMLHVEE